MHCEHWIELLPTPLEQAAQGYLLDILTTTWPTPEIRNLVASQCECRGAPARVTVHDTVVAGKVLHNSLVYNVIYAIARLWEGSLK